MKCRPMKSTHLFVFICTRIALSNEWMYTVPFVLSLRQIYNLNNSVYLYMHFFLQRRSVCPFLDSVGNEHLPRLLWLQGLEGVLSFHLQLPMEPELPKSLLLPVCYCVGCIFLTSGPGVWANLYWRLRQIEDILLRHFQPWHLFSFEICLFSHYLFHKDVDFSNNASVCMYLCFCSWIKNTFLLP